MVGFIIGVLILSLWLGIIIGCCYCGWLNKVREIRIERNWPFMKVIRRGDNMIQTRRLRQRRHRNENRNRCRNQEVVQNNIEVEEQVVLAMEYRESN